MDSRVVHSHVEEENVEPQQVTLGAEENHSLNHEKKSVLNKVKTKAKKIKDTIKKHGQQVLDHGNGHNNEIQHTPDDVDLDEDKQLVQDPQDHQAPIYDSEDVKSATPTPTPTPTSEQEENLGNSGIDIEGTGEESSHDPRFEGVSSTTEINRNISTDQAKTFAVEEKPEQYKANLEKPIIVLEEDSQEQGSRTEEYTLPNYQTKETDPSGVESEEIKDITPLEESLERMNVHDEPKPTTEPKIQSSVADIEHPPAEAYTLPNYQIKDTDPSGEDEIKDLKPLEESLVKMNVHDEESKPTTEPKIQSPVADTEYPPTAGSHDRFVPHFSDATKTENEYPQETVSKDINRNQEILEEDSQEQRSRTDEAYTLPNYQTKDTDRSGEGSGEIKEKTSLEESLEGTNVHDEPKPTTEPKIQLPVAASTEYPPSSGSRDIDQFVPHLSDATETQNEYPQVTVPENINRNQEIPSETRENIDTITKTVEKQPGYEEPVETQPKQKSYTDEIEISSVEEADKTLPPENDEASKLGNDEKVEHKKSENGNNVGYSLTEKLAPVYGKAAEVGSAVKSKVYGTNVGTETKNGDKGVTVKDYLAEKLKPSEEDKALSEVISETLHKGKEEPLKKEDGKLDSEIEKSEKVFEERNVTSPGKGMVDKVKDAVGSWFVKSPRGGGIGEDLSKNKKSVGEVEQVVDEGVKQEQSN